MALKKGAVIGIGGIGIWHGQMMRDTKRVDVCALCDARPAMQERAKEHFPEATFYTSVEEMFAAEQIDLVALAIPHNLHAPVAITALNAGANVVVEKPMATRYADCLAMIAAAKANKRFLTVFHNRRLDGWYLAAKSVIDDGLLGNLVEMQSGINYRCGPETWRGFKEAGGGIMYDWGAHLVDYLLHFAGSDVQSVSGSFYRAPDADPALNEDHGSVRINFASGATGVVTISAIDHSSPLRYKLVGDKGTLTDEWQWTDTDKLKVFTRLSGGEQTVMEVTYRKTVPQRYYDNVVDSLYEGTQPRVTPESAAKIINIFNTAERSFAEGGVPLPLE